MVMMLSLPGRASARLKPNWLRLNWLSGRQLHVSGQPPYHISSPQILAARLKWAQSVGVKLKQARRVVILCLPQVKWSIQLVNSVQMVRLSSRQFNRSAQ